MLHSTHFPCRRVWWLLVLILWGLGVACLIAGARLNSGRYLTWDEEGVLWLMQPKTGNWQWDFRSNRWQSVAEGAPPWIPDTSGTIQLKPLDTTRIDGELSRYLASIRRPDGEVDEIEFQFPTSPIPFGSHFVVGMLNVVGQPNPKWIVLDLHLTTGQIRDLPLKGSHGLTNVNDIQSKNTFIHVDDSAKPMQLEVIELLDGGLTRIVNAWSIGTAGSELLEDGRVRTISLDLSQIETRDPMTGEILETLPVPDEVDRVFAQFYPGLGFLVEEVLVGPAPLVYKFYDLTTGQSLKMPPLMITQRPRLRSRALWMFVGETADGRGHVCVYNSHTHSIEWQQPLGPRCVGRFIDESHIGLADRRHGLTAQVIDLSDGHTVAQIRPWWWVGPVLILCSIGFAVWAYGWVRAAPPHAAWTWFDVCLLAVLGLTPLLWRLTSVGSRSDVDRLLFAYLQGIFTALAQVCVVWIVFGRSTRWLLRCVPLVAVMSILLVVLSFIFQPPVTKNALTILFNRMNFAWEGFTLTVIATAISLFVFAILVSLNFRLVRQSDSDEQGLRQSGQLPLRDMFVAITCAALLLATFRPLLMNLPTRTPRVEWDLVVTIALANAAHVVLLILAYSSNRRFFRLGNIVSGVLLLAMIAIPVIDFAEQVRLAPLVLRWRKFFLVSATSLVWFQAFLLIFRYRNRLRWA